MARNRERERGRERETETEGVHAQNEKTGWQH